MGRHRGKRYQRVPNHSNTSAAVGEVPKGVRRSSVIVIGIIVLTVVAAGVALYLTNQIPGLTSPFAGHYSS